MHLCYWSSPVVPAVYIPSRLDPRCKHDDSNIMKNDVAIVVQSWGCSPCPDYSCLILSIICYLILWWLLVTT